MRAVEQSMFPELRSNKAVGPLLGSVISGTNADLIHAIRDIYLTGTVLDVTYGRGGWWKTWQPEPSKFQWHDIATDGVDFTDLPYADRTWDTVCYDPPYICAGGTNTSTAGDFQQRFGVDGGRSRDALDALMVAGLLESARVCSEYLLVKCMDFVDSNVFVPMTYRMFRAAEDAGLTFHDEIIHHAGSGPGGHNIVTPKRARRHHSKLLVFTWGRR